MVLNGHGGGRPGGSSIKVIARLPALDAEREAPPEREPEAGRLPPPPVRNVQVIGRLPSSEPQRFPLRSVMTLALVAAITWTAALWNDRQRLHAERAAQARLEQSAVQPRAERLAREGNPAR